MIIEQFLAWLQTAVEEDREKAAFALAEVWLEPEIDQVDREITEAALTLLLEDESRMVRLALAEAFACIDSAPRHLIHALAGDECEIAAVVLLNSQVLLDAELAAIVKGGVREQQVAIASRATVGHAVSATLATHGEEEAVLVLLDNAGADIALPALHVIAQRHGTKTDIRRRLLMREALQPETRLLLIDKLCEALRTRVLDEDALPAGKVEQILAHHTERAIIAHVAQSDASEIPVIVKALIEQGRMTTAFLLRAICLGNIALFSTALGQLSDMPVHRVEATLAGGKRQAFRAIYMRAGLPERAFEVFGNAIDIWRKVLVREADADGYRLTWLVTRELLETYRGAPDPATDGLLVLLRKLASEAARHNARYHADRIQSDMRERQLLLAETREAMLALDTETEPETVDAAQQYPVIDVPEPVLAKFALHFADEIVELEERLAMAEFEPAAGELPLHSGPAANDDVAAIRASRPLYIDLGDAKLRPRIAA